MNSVESKNSMDVGQHRRSFGTPTKMSMSKFMVLPSAVVSRSAALPGTGRIYLCSVQGIAADSVNTGLCDVCGYLRLGAGRYFPPPCDLAHWGDIAPRTNQVALLYPSVPALSLQGCDACIMDSSGSCYVKLSIGLSVLSRGSSVFQQSVHCFLE